ncbi:MAG: PLD nuclease N-terminal domain-containing protein [Firmicutes bacterium]|nr:PLD nuclease N-terminal domain-containing protein [Bacillota bacterium]
MNNRAAKTAIAGLGLLLGTTGLAFAGRGDAAAATGVMCFAGVISLVMLAVSIYIMVWVYKDAKNRGTEPILWLILVFFTGIIGLVIYYFVRPQGILTACHNCGKPKLDTLPQCPHCGAGM